MRQAAGLIGVIASLVLLTFGAGTAYADPPGNNGTIKIHEVPEREPVMANDPHVCVFHIHGFNFDRSSSGSWWILGWAPTGDGNQVSSGSFSANAAGEWITATITLPNGHYKAYAKQTNEPTPGGNKQKVFWVECAGQGTSTSGGSSSGSNTTTTTTTTGGGTVNNNGNSGSNANSGGNANTGANVSANGGNGAQAVAGVQTSPQAASGAAGAGQGPTAVAGVESLPSTSTNDDSALVGVGAALATIGVLLLRRRTLRVR